MEPTSSIYSKEQFEEIAHFAEEMRKRELNRFITSSEAVGALKELIKKVQAHTLQVMETLHKLSQGVTTSSAEIDGLIAPDVQGLLSEFKRHFSQIERGEMPFTVYQDRIEGFSFLEPLYRKYLPKELQIETTWKEHALRIEQEILHENYRNLYLEHLHALAKLTQSKEFKPHPISLSATLGQA